MKKVERVAWGVAVIVCAAGAVSAGTYSGGTGTREDSNPIRGAEPMVPSPRLFKINGIYVDN